MRISNQKLAIGIPLTFPQVPSQFFDSFTLMEKPPFEYIRANNGPIHELRNNIVNTALALGATNLIMMDVDQIYHPKTIPTLLAHNLPVVGALVHRRYPPFDSLMMKMYENDNVRGYGPIDDWEDGALVEVDATGTGCIMYDMEVFRKLPAPWFKAECNPDGSPIGEDFGFCSVLKDNGYRIFVDTSVPAGHLTTMIVNTATNRLYRAMKGDRQKQALGVVKEEKVNGG